jgi:hypothetical protein
MSDSRTSSGHLSGRGWPRPGSLAVIGWIWWSMLPFEVACDTIDDELARRGVWLG